MAGLVQCLPSWSMLHVFELELLREFMKRATVLFTLN